MLSFFFPPTELKLYYKCIFFLSPHLIGTLEITKLRSAKHFLSICRLEAQRSRISLLTETGRVPGGRDGCRTLGELGKIQTRRTECRWHRPAIPELGRLGQDRCEFQSIPSYRMRPSPPQTDKQGLGRGFGRQEHPLSNGGTEFKSPAPCRKLGVFLVPRRRCQHCVCIYLCLYVCVYVRMGWGWTGVSLGVSGFQPSSRFF